MLIAGAIGIAGYGMKEINKKYVYGTVLKESGTVVDRQKAIESSKGAIFGNESVKPTYVIHFKLDKDNKVYRFAIEPTYAGELEVLNMAINEGTRIRIREWFFNTSNHCLDRGTTFSNEIDVLDQK